jgi:hypothetical protein
MHWIYNVYLFMCTVQPPVCATLVAVGMAVPCRIISTSNATGAVVAVVKTETLSMESSCASAFAVFFSILYMINQSSSPPPRFLLRASFWYFVFYHACIVHCGWPEPFARSEIYVMAGIRTLAMWMLCRTEPDEKTAGQVGGACMYCFWGLVYFYYFFSCWLIFPIILVDALLAIGHGYDDDTPPDVVYNCRLCFIAISGWIVLATPFVVRL